MLALPELNDALIRVDYGIAWLTLNRDDLRNVLTGTDLIADLEKTVHFVNHEKAISVLVITGAGKAFSAGGNLKEMAGRDSSHADGPYAGPPEAVKHKYQEGIQRIPKAMAALTKPCVAAINGPAIGAGFDLALMADLRIASPKAKFGETFVNLGLISGIGGAWWLQRELGYQQAARLTLLGEVLDAEEALRLGLLLEIAPADQLLERAGELARQLADKPPMALGLNKQLLMTAQATDFDHFLERCAELQGYCHNQEDHLEAVNAFLEQRRPKFKGQ